MGGKWTCPKHKKERQMICVKPHNYKIICPDCQGEEHSKKRGCVCENISDFLESLGDSPEEKKKRLMEMRATIEGQKFMVTKEKAEIDAMVNKGQQEVAMEANSVLSGYAKTSEFARKKVSASILSLNQQEQLCNYYLGVLSNIGSKDILSKKYNPDECSTMISGWQTMELQMASPAAAVDASIQDLKAKKEDFSSLHHEIVGKLKGLQISWLQYALSDPASLEGFARDIFSQVDVDKSGELEFHEVLNFMKVFLGALGGVPPSNEEIHAMFLKYDADKSGKLSYVESLELAKDILKVLISKSENKPSVGPGDPAKNILTN